MISRRSAFALAFASLATLSVTVAAEVRHGTTAVRPVATIAAPARPQIAELPRVVITGRVQRPAATP